jgi:hypothetical protein
MECVNSTVNLQRQCPCGKPLSPRHYRYCADCAPTASVIWKRAQRRLNKGAPYWLDYWLKLTGSEDGARRAYNAYMCDYMRRRRKRSRALIGSKSKAV